MAAENIGRDVPRTPASTASMRPRRMAAENADLDHLTALLGVLQ